MENQKMKTKRFKNISLFLISSWLIIGSFGWKQATQAGKNRKSFSGHVDQSLLIHPNHIIFLWLENKDFDTIVGNSGAPFINSLLKKGTLFTNAHAITHPSYPNYVDFFAGDPNGIKDDACFVGSGLSTPNLYTILKQVRKSFAWYSEDLPVTGSKVCIDKNYVAKHNPTSIFTNVPASANKRFTDFPADYNKLENVVCISPNLVNDMHDGTIKGGDSWMKNHLASLVKWCLAHNGVFVIYFDESGSNKDNQIPVIAIGSHVKPNYQLNTNYDHFCWTKTVCDMFSAPDSWTHDLRAASLITGCWK